MERFRTVLCVFIVAVASQLNAFSQRTALGTRFISVSGQWSQINVSSVGGEIMYGQYLLPGYWFGGVNFTNRIEIDGASQLKVNYPRLQGLGGYMQRLFGTRQREFNVYAGGDIFIGAEFMDLFNTLPSHVKAALHEAGRTDARFIYGLSPRVELEYFFVDSWAILAKFRLPICFNTQYDIIGYEFGIGVKWNF